MGRSLGWDLRRLRTSQVVKPGTNGQACGREVCEIELHLRRGAVNRREFSVVVQFEIYDAESEVRLAVEMPTAASMSESSAVPTIST